MKSMLSKLRGNALARHTLTLSASNVLMYVLPFLVTPILSRLYTTEDYGEWGVFSCTYLMIHSVLFLSYENVIVKTTDERELAPLLKACVMVAACIVALTLLVFGTGRMLGIGFFCRFPYLWLLAALLVVAAASQLCYCLSNRFERYALMSVSGIVQGVAQAAFRLLFSLQRWLNGLVLGNVLAVIFGLGTFVVGLRRTLWPLLQQPSAWPQVRAVLRKYRKFPLFDAPGVVLEAAIFHLALIV